MAEVRLDPSCPDTTFKCQMQLRKGDEDRSYLHRIIVPILYLNEIPGAMDKMGWVNSAKLMRNWFANPAWRMSKEEREGLEKNTGKPIVYANLPSSRIEESIIKMDWVLKHPEAQKAYQFLRSNWNTPRGAGLLYNRLIATGWRPGTSYFRLGNREDRASIIDNTNQVNARPFGSLLDTFDDFFGAINKATMKVALTGYTEYDKVHKKDFFIVTQEGYYIRDTYDFNTDSWYEDPLMGLGVWSRDRVLSKAETLDYKTRIAKILVPADYVRTLYMYGGFVPVINNDFYRWQDKHGTGGDFFVFSDVLWLPNQPHMTKIEILPFLGNKQK